MLQPILEIRFRFRCMILIQLPVNAPGKTENGSPSTWTPDSHLRELNGVPDSWLQAGSLPNVHKSWGWYQFNSWLFHFLIPLSAYSFGNKQKMAQILAPRNPCGRPRRSFWLPAFGSTPFCSLWPFSEQIGGLLWHSGPAINPEIAHCPSINKDEHQQAGAIDNAVRPDQEITHVQVQGGTTNNRQFKVCELFLSGSLHLMFLGLYYG